MNKWEKILPDGLSKCLGQYFEKNYLWSPKRDPRFRHQNQARRCFVEFVDYQKCLKAKSEKECEYSCNFLFQKYLKLKTKFNLK